MVKMKKRPDGRWQKSIKLPNGKRKVFYSTLPTQRQAEADIMRQAMSFKDKEEKGLLFSKVAELWEREHLPKLAHSTQERYRSLINCAVDYFSDVYINEITPLDIKKFMQKKIKQGFSAKTIEHQKSVLGLILKFACVEGYLTENPAQYITVPKGLPKNPRTIPTKQEIEIVKNSTDKPFGMIAYFFLHLGLRKGEMLALDAKNINIAEKRIKISESVFFKGNFPYVKTPKTAAGIREGILLDCLVDKLPNIKSGLIFPGKSGSYMTHSEFHMGWKAYQKATGLTITPHQLRHAYASYILHDAGIDVKTAQFLMGHADISTTQNIYTQITTNKLKAVEEQLNIHTQM